MSMDFEDVERIKMMECMAFDDGFFCGHETIGILDGKEFEYGDKIILLEEDKKIRGWNGYDGNDCVEFKICSICGTFITTKKEWARCMGLGN